MSSVQFCKLTNLNIAFANPDKKGNLIFKGDIDRLINYAKSVNPGIIISISLGEEYYLQNKLQIGLF